MGAATVLLSWNFALWASGHWRNRLIGLEKQTAFVLAAVSVPDASALEAHFLAKRAHCSVATAAWLSDYLAAVRPWAPLESLVTANLDVVLDRLERLHNLLGTKLLNVLGCKTLLALELHARDFKGLSIYDSSLEIGTRTVDAECVAASKREEVFFFKVLIAAVACFSTFFDRLDSTMSVLSRRPVWCWSCPLSLSMFSLTSF